MSVLIKKKTKLRFTHTAFDKKEDHFGFQLALQLSVLGVILTLSIFQSPDLTGKIWVDTFIQHILPFYTILFNFFIKTFFFSLKPMSLVSC